MNKLLRQFGNIDIYLFDQLLKGRLSPPMRILDAGCGGGRNLVYLMQENYEVYGVDQNAEVTQQVQLLASQCGGNPDNFQAAYIDSMPFSDASFNFVICNAVLHFARDKNHFETMLQELWRVVAKEGYLFIRLASDIGITQLTQPLGNGQFALPDGSTRYLVSLDDLLHYTKELNATLFEPIKTTNVQNLRCMTTWCLQKL